MNTGKEIQISGMFPFFTQVVWLRNLCKYFKRTEIWWETNFEWSLKVEITLSDLNPYQTLVKIPKTL